MPTQQPRVSSDDGRGVEDPPVMTPADDSLLDAVWDHAADEDD